MVQVPIVSVVNPPVPEMTEGDHRSPDPLSAASPVLHRAPHASLRLIATSDLHASLMPYDYCANRPNAQLGLGAVSQQIADARRQAAEAAAMEAVFGPHRHMGEGLVEIRLQA